MLSKKICMLGASGVGKTSLVKQFVEGIFNEKYLTTIGVKIDKKLLKVADQRVQFMLWDIEGTDRYAAFSPRHLRGAAAYIIVTDLTRSQSLIDAQDIKRLASQVSDAPSIILLNKADLDPMFQLDDEQIHMLEKDHLFVVKTSAKTGENVEFAFQSLAEQLVKCMES